MTRRIVLGCSDIDVIGRVASVAVELGDEIVRTTSSSSDTIDAVAATHPDVLIVADSLGPVPVLDLIRQVARQDPFTGILLLAAQADHEVYRVAMEAGARSVAPLDFTVDDLGQRIDNAATWSRIVRAHLTDQAVRSYGTGHVVVLAGSKGGVGTTTMAVHVALQAAAAGRRCCLVDLDLQGGDVAALLDISHRRDIVDLVAVAGEVTGQSLDDALYRHVSGLHVLLAPREGERGEEVTGQVARAVMGAVKSRFDVVVVDVGSVLTPAGVTAVEIADRAVVVITPDVLSARGARRTVQLWDRLRIRNESEVVVLLNRASRNVEVQPDLAAKLVRMPVMEPGVPSSFRALEAATNAGDPTRLVDRDLRRALARVAEELGVRTNQARPPATAAVAASYPSAATPYPPGAAPYPPGAAPYQPGAQPVPGTVPLVANGDTGALPVVPAGAAAAAAVGAAPDAGAQPAPAPPHRAARPRRLGRRERGQTTAEFMGLVPLMLIFIFALFQGGLIGFSHVVSAHAAARGARTAVSPLATDGAIHDAVVNALPQAWRDGVQVEVGDRLTDPDASVTVTVHTPTLIPVVATLFGPDALEATSTAQMRFEGVSEQTP